MFDIGLLEMLLVAVVALLILGPQGFPIAVRAVLLWLARFSRSLDGIKADIQQEVGLDDLREQIKSDELLQQIQSAADDAAQSISKTTT